MTPEQIAQVAHEANRAYCLTLGDGTQPAWQHAPEWQRESAICGVLNMIGSPLTTPEQSHACWLDGKIRDGWSWGPIKDPALKEHPCMVPYDELPEAQKRKDHIFRAIVVACREAV